MNGKKRRFENFALYDYQGVEAHLSRMAAKGWRLEKAGNTLWTYREAEPAEVRYAVTYSHRVSQFDPVPTEDQEVLSDLCEAAGWSFVCDWNQMQIFASEDPNPVPLETDEALRLDVIHKTMKKHYFPANIVLLVLALFIVASNINTIIRTPLRFFGSNSRMFSALMFLMVALLVLHSLGFYLLWRRRSEKSIAAGGNCVPLRSNYRKFSLISLIFVTFCAIGYAVLEAVTRQVGYAVFYIVYLALLFLLITLVQGTKKLLKGRGVSRGKNMTITLAVDFILAFALMGGLMYAAFRFDWFDGGKQQDSYIYQKESWDTEPASIPLTITEITGEEFDHIRRSDYSHGSILLSIHEYRERVLRESDGARQNLSYGIQEPHTQWLYDAVLEDRLSSRSIDGFSRMYTWQEEDPTIWGADFVYQQYEKNVSRHIWLLCWPGRIVTLNPDGALSPEEMSRIGQKLRP